MKNQLIANLFPQLVEAKWGEINLEAIAEDLLPLLSPLMKDRPFNPFLNPFYCDQWKDFIHKVKGIDYSWGGYLENRATVWAGHYQDPSACIHVGVDYYVPANIEVHCPVQGKLVYAHVDPDQNGGWGGWMIFQRKDEYVILAHMKDLSHEVGKTFLPGEKIAAIAESSCNGGWSPHLHLQRVKGKDLVDVLKIDGYTKQYKGIEEDFPNPNDILG
jgi:hypothetical protein